MENKSVTYIDLVKKEQLQKEFDYLRNAPTRKEILAEYESNRRKAAQLQAEILKGANAGEDIYNLFLQASEVISLMTDNKPFIKQIKADITAIYGLALEEQTPLKTALEIVQGRIDKLTLALQQKSICEADKKRITTALQKSNQEKEHINNKIRKS